ncbi:hypothetical protein [Amycolatopsis anabasis]|uniref:hypothetical protein n=1 Tax=Amycolatopsis anabasis TaxID=1840409 RepID=UPI00131CEE25|nr:hypothetical protein [Amycolatopsis anabasis]
MTSIDEELGRAIADRLLNLLRDAEVEALATELGTLVGRYGPRRHLLRPLLAQLIAETADRVRESTGPMGECGAFAVDVRDDGDQAVDMDELRPPMRAMLRAVLALLSDHPADAEVQLDLAVADPNPLGRMDAVVHALLWVDGLRDPHRGQAAGSKQ